jgi:hypothetical protein
MQPFTQTTQDIVQSFGESLNLCFTQEKNSRELIMAFDQMLVQLAYTILFSSSWMILARAPDLLLHGLLQTMLMVG